MSALRSSFRHLILCICVVSLILPMEASAAKRRARTMHRGAASSANSGVNDARYSDIVLNPDTGEIYHSKSADMRRYPASLTKMMTLYLLFDALEKKKVTLNTRLPISDYATTMPQTNLSLSAGDDIPVDTAIKALVVRSANDVAVVVAEALGGDVDSFADMMTAKARALGMTGTHFANPNGLPNEDQYTTARDMAKLGIALRRDFPKYYPYFAVREFSWAGVSYYTHNRVMLRYAGVDGIKTGFIGASGFNLVTSCKRGGRPLIGVVMGGSSGAWRDNRMIQLLDEAYAQIASQGAARSKGTPQNLPASKNGAPSSNDVSDDATETPDDAPIPPPTNAPVSKPTTPAAGTTPAPFANQSNSAPPPPIPDKLVPVAPSASASTAVPFGTASATTALKPVVMQGAPEESKTNGALVVKIPNAPNPPTKPTIPAVSAVNNASPAISQTNTIPAATTWSIQVGAFRDAKMAENAAQKAYRQARSNLDGARVRIVASNKKGNYRARLVNLTQDQANKACDTLKAAKADCMVMRADAK